MRDFQRLQHEIKILSQSFGSNRVWRDQHFNWVMVEDWPLPPNLNYRTSYIIVLIPPNYGNGEPLRDSFIDPGILARNPRTGRFEAIPHYYKEFPYAQLLIGTKTEWRDRQWQYICIHEQNCGTRQNIHNYLLSVYKFLADPFRDWSGTFSSYRR